MSKYLLDYPYTPTPTNHPQPPIYVINFKDDHRRSKMIQRFDSVGLSLRFVPPVYTTDVRLQSIVDPAIDKRVWSIMLQHLDSIRDFVENTDAAHCIVCEDDITISKRFAEYLPEVLAHFDACQLDVLLLGYLMPYRIEKNAHTDEKILFQWGGFSFFPYGEDLWGSQMYLLSRKHAQYLLDTYTVDYALAHLEEPFSPDWVLTKRGRRSLLYPMLAVEEGVTKTDDDGQNAFHQQCFETHFDSALYH